MKDFLQNKVKLNLLPKFLFILSLCMVSLLYGFFAFPNEWFPFSLIENAVNYINEKAGKSDRPYYYVDSNDTMKVPIYKENAAYNGFSLVTSVIEDDKLSARVIDMKGEVVHEWEIDWFELWPNVTHIPQSDPSIPKSRPGVLIHGAILLENGDLIFNFDYLGMIKVDICGNVVWRLPYRTHHSICLDEFGYLWAPGLIRHDEPLPYFPNQQVPFDELTIIKVSLNGEVVKEISVYDVLNANGLAGLLRLSSSGGHFGILSGDPLHLNDVEIFPSDMEEGLFKAGDIMLSFRNANTILVFREEDLKLVYVATGLTVGQHDPDFINGNSISVYDNLSMTPNYNSQNSGILVITPNNNESYNYFVGSEDFSFYSETMGKHQWLPNGNLLVTSTNQGKAFEVDTDGNIVWEYVNLVGDGYAGWVSDVHRLPELFTEAYFAKLTQACEAVISD